MTMTKTRRRNFPVHIVNTLVTVGKTWQNMNAHTQGRGRIHAFSVISPVAPSMTWHSTNESIQGRSHTRVNIVTNGLPTVHQLPPTCGRTRVKNRIHVNSVANLFPWPQVCKDINWLIQVKNRFLVSTVTNHLLISQAWLDTCEYTRVTSPIHVGYAWNVSRISVAWRNMRRSAGGAFNSTKRLRKIMTNRIPNPAMLLRMKSGDFWMLELCVKKIKACVKFLSSKVNVLLSWTPSSINDSLPFSYFNIVSFVCCWMIRL